MAIVHTRDGWDYSSCSVCVLVWVIFIMLCCFWHVMFYWNCVGFGQSPFKKKLLAPSKLRRRRRVKSENLLKSWWIRRRGTWRNGGLQKWRYAAGCGLLTGTSLFGHVNPTLLGMWRLGAVYIIYTNLYLFGCSLNRLNAHVSPARKTLKSCKSPTLALKWDQDSLVFLHPILLR